MYIYSYGCTHTHTKRDLSSKEVFKQHGTTSCIMAVVSDYVLACTLKERCSTALPTFGEVLYVIQCFTSGCAESE